MVTILVIPMPGNAQWCFPRAGRHFVSSVFTARSVLTTTWCGQYNGPHFISEQGGRTERLSDLFKVMPLVSADPGFDADGGISEAEPLLWIFPPERTNQDSEGAVSEKGGATEDVKLERGGLRKSGIVLCFFFFLILFLIFFF